MLFLFFQQLFAAPKPKISATTNILYVTDQNMSKTFEDLSAVFLLCYQGGDKTEQFRAKSEFTSASYSLGTRCYFALIDGERNPRFVQTYKQIYTRGYYFFRYGKMVTQYFGVQRTENFAWFAMSKTGCPFTTFDDYPEAQDFIERNEVGVVLYIPELGGKIMDKYTKFAQQLRDNFTFGLCPDELIADELGVTEFPTLILYRQKDHARVVFQEPFDTASPIEIKNWINYNSKPLVDVFQIQDQKIYYGKKPTAIFFIPVEDERKVGVLETIIKLSEVYSEDIKFTQIDAASGNRFMMDLGYSHYADPVFAVLKYDKKGKYEKYMYSEDAEFTFDNISNYLMDYLDGRIKPNHRSQSLPEDYNGSVLLLNADNFVSEVVEPDVAVLVLYYEPWDRLYNDFKDEYEKIADEFAAKKIKRIKLASFNVAENDIVSGIDPKKTPSLYLYRRGQKKEPLPFPGKLKRERIFDFLDDEIGITVEL